MPKGLKLRRNFPYSEFGSWLNSDSKLSFDNYINIRACNATLEMQNTNKNIIMEENKMLHSKDIFSEEKHGLKNQILHNHGSLNVDNSTELKMGTDFNLFNASKICVKLHNLDDNLSFTDHKPDSEVQNPCSTESTAESTTDKNLDAFYVVLSSNDSSDSSGKKDLKLNGHEVRAEKLNFKDVFAKSEESIPQDVSPATSSFNSKICDDECLNLNTICNSGKDVIEEAFNTPAFVVKILSEANGDKYSSSKADNICENEVEKTVNEMFSSMNTANLKYASNTASILHKLCNKQEDEAITGLLISTDSASKRESQSDNSYVLEKSELSDGKDLKLDVPLVSAEKLNFEGIFAKFKESVPQDVTVTSSSSDLKIRDDKCLNLKAASAMEKNVLEEPFNITVSAMDKILLEAESEESIYSISSISTSNLDWEEDEVHEAVLINTASSSQNIIQSVDYYLSGKNESAGGEELKLDVDEASTMDKILLEAESQESINSISSISTSNLDWEEDEVHKAALINTASSSQNITQSVDYYLSEKIESAGGEELKLDVHEASAEKISLQCILAKSEESVPQDVSPVTSYSSDPEICNDKCLNLNITHVVKRDELFNTTAPIIGKISSDTDDNKSLSAKTSNTFENQIEKFVSEMSSTNTASSNFNSANETNAKTQKALDESSSSENKFQPFDFYELEKSDIEDPEWENVKKLKSNEERYKQVRKCWDTKNIPNPNKNLTYHSYRKHKLKAGKLDGRLIKQHKRQASEKSAHPPTKRTRCCTYAIDNQIQSIKSEQFSQTAIIENEMEKQVNILDYNFSYQVSELNKHYDYYPFNYKNSGNHFMRDRNLLEMQYNRNLCDIKSKYYKKIDSYKSQCQSKINALQKAHDEILTFCNFYEGLREDNPTVLTGVQLQEIEEIDDVYEQLNKYYN